MYEIMQKKNCIDAFPTLLLETEFGQAGMNIKETASPMGSYLFENALQVPSGQTPTIGTFIQELQRRKKVGKGLTGEHPVFTHDPAKGIRYELTYTDEHDSDLVLPA